MIVQQMHIAWGVELDKTNRLEYPDFRPEEVDYWLNRSVEDIVRQRYTGMNATRSSVEETQKRRDDLRNITKNYTIAITLVQTADNKPNGYFVSLPADYYYALEEEVEIAYVDCHGGTTFYEYMPDYGIYIGDARRRIPVKPITHDRYNKIKEDPFNTPNEDEAICLPYQGDKNEIIVGSGIYPITYYLRYLRKPATISLSGSVNCDLSQHLHAEIVTNAVNLAIENIESPRIVTQGQQVVKNE